MTAPVDWFELSLHGGSTDRDGHHELLAGKRRECPVEQVTPFGADSPEMYAVYRYTDVTAVLSDPERFSLDVVEQRYRAVLGRSFLTAAPRVRRALRRVLREQFQADTAGLVAQVVADRVESLRGAHDPVDLVAPLAAQVPARVMTALLGLPEADWHAVAELSAAVAGFAQHPRRALRAARALRKHFAAALRDPRGGLIPVLAGTEIDGCRLDEAELASSLLLLAWAGTETAGPAIANCLYALLTHPGLADGVRADPGLAPAAADEALRWETPVQITSRRAETDTEIAGVRLPAGATVLAHLGAANRDPQRFVRPERYDPGRSNPPRPVAFGHGPHHCLGAALARTEIASCVRVLLERFPELRLSPDAPAPEGQVVRCPRRLPVYLS